MIAMTRADVSISIKPTRLAPTPGPRRFNSYDAPSFSAGSGPMRELVKAATLIINGSGT
jgi:hypothetical protein